MKNNSITSIMICIALVALAGWLASSCSDDDSSHGSTSTGTGTGTGTSTGTGTGSASPYESGTLYFSVYTQLSCSSWILKSITVQDNADYACGVTGWPVPPPYMPGWGTLNSSEYEAVVSAYDAADFLNLDNEYFTGGNSSVLYTLKHTDSSETIVEVYKDATAPSGLSALVTHMAALLDDKY